MGEVHLSNDNRWHPKTGRKPSQLDLFLGEALTDPVAFGRQVRQERQRMGLSQRAFGQRIGCQQAHVANVERGHDRFSEWSRRRLVELVRREA
jgi:DNA-binding transcriptional regulator YiaG